VGNYDLNCQLVGVNYENAGGRRSTGSRKPHASRGGPVSARACMVRRGCCITERGKTETPDLERNLLNDQTFVLRKRAQITSSEVGRYGMKLGSPRE